MVNGRAAIIPGVCALWALACTGCATSKEGDEPIASLRVERYAPSFDTAKIVLRDAGFTLERVDATGEGGGVITTRAKTTAGLVTPWDREQSTFGQELEDLFQRQQRVARITFEPAGEDGAALAPDSPATMTVHVVVQRVQVPGHKIEPEAVFQHSYYFDPELAERQMVPSYAVAWKEDRLLAARLAAEISRRNRAAAEWTRGVPVQR